MHADTGLPIRALRWTAGASANNFLMQFQADILGCEVLRPQVRETTGARGGVSGGATCGIWSDTAQIRERGRSTVRFLPGWKRKRGRPQLAQWPPRGSTACRGG